MSLLGGEGGLDKSGWISNVACGYWYYLIGRSKTHRLTIAGHPLLWTCHHVITQRTDAANTFGLIVDLYVAKDSLLLLLVFQSTHDGYL